MLRRPDGGAIAFGRSACSTCGHRLGAIDLIPLLSRAALSGRYRHCGARLGWFCSGTELLVLITSRAVRSQREVRRVTEELRKRLRAIVPLGTRIR